MVLSSWNPSQLENLLQGIFWSSYKKRISTVESSILSHKRTILCFDVYWEVLAERNIWLTGNLKSVDLTNGSFLLNLNQA